MIANETITVVMSHSQICYEKLNLRHAWLNLWDKHMTTGRINQVFKSANPQLTNCQLLVICLSFAGFEHSIARLAVQYIMIIICNCKAWSIRYIQTMRNRSQPYHCLNTGEWNWANAPCVSTNGGCSLEPNTSTMLPCPKKGTGNPSHCFVFVLSIVLVCGVCGIENVVQNCEKGQLKVNQKELTAA